MLEHEALVPQLAVGHSSTSVHVAALPEVAVPLKPARQAQVNEPTVLVHAACCPQTVTSLHSSTSVQLAGAPVVGAPEYPLAQVQVNELAVDWQVALAPHWPVAVQRSTVEQLVGPPVTVAPNTPAGQLHSNEPRVLLHTASVPQSWVAHSSTSMHVPPLHSLPAGQTCVTAQLATHSRPPVATTQVKSGAQSASVVHEKRVVF